MAGRPKVDGFLPEEPGYRAFRKVPGAGVCAPRSLIALKRKNGSIPTEGSVPKNTVKTRDGVEAKSQGLFKLRPSLSFTLVRGSFTLARGDYAKDIVRLGSLMQFTAPFECMTSH